MMRPFELGGTSLIVLGGVFLGGMSMTRAIARTLTILAMILGLTIATMVPTASAGSLSGAGGDRLIVDLLGANPGTCEYIQNSQTSTYFVAIATGNSGAVAGIKIVRIAAPLPEQFSSVCFFAGQFDPTT
jgi:hypothetical protein